MRFSLRFLLIATGVIAVIIGAATYGLRTIDRIVGDAYRVWGTGDLVVSFMKANEQRWPHSWEELESHYERSNQFFPGIRRFSDAKDHMEINFSFTPKTVDLSHEDSNPPFRAIWLRNGTNTAYEGTGPNEIVYRHLKSLQRPPTPGSTVNLGDPN